MDVGLPPTIISHVRNNYPLIILTLFLGLVFAPKSHVGRNMLDIDSQQRGF